MNFNDKIIFEMIEKSRRAQTPSNTNIRQLAIDSFIEIVFERFFRFNRILIFMTAMMIISAGRVFKSNFLMNK